MPRFATLVSTALTALLTATAIPAIAYSAENAVDEQATPADPEVAGETDDAADEKIPGIDPDESLSEQLHEDEGVIDPPPVGDSEIHVPAPDPHPGTTIVIPPPGSPGGDPTVQPK